TSRFLLYILFLLFFFITPPTTQFYTLSLHDALPISFCRLLVRGDSPGNSAWQEQASLLVGTSHSRTRRDAPAVVVGRTTSSRVRSEEHTSELQSRFDLVCRLLLEKKKK